RDHRSNRASDPLAPAPANALTTTVPVKSVALRSSIARGCAHGGSTALGPKNSFRSIALDGVDRRCGGAGAFRERFGGRRHAVLRLAVPPLGRPAERRLPRPGRALLGRGAAAPSDLPRRDLRRVSP